MHAHKSLSQRCKQTLSLGTPSPPSPRERGRLVIHIRLRQSERAQSSPVHARWQVPGGSHIPAGCMWRAGGIEGASRAPPCEARDLGTAAPERFWHKNRPPKECACPGACVRGMVLRRACKPLEVIVCACCGMKEVGALCGPGGGISALVFAAARGARHRAAHSHAVTSSLPARGANTPRGARGELDCLGWARHTPAVWPAPGAATYNDDAPRPVCARRVKHEDRAKRGTHLREVVDLIGGRRRGRSAGAAQPSESRTLLLLLPL